MNKVANITAGLFLGVAIGAGLALLLVPRSGAETKQAIRDRVDAILAEGHKAAEVRRIELSERFEMLKQPGGQIQPT